MIKVEVIEKFTLKNFDELKNIKRRNFDEKGTLFVGDTFECNKDMVDYLTGNNPLNKAVVKVIEVKPEKGIEHVEEEKEEWAVVEEENAVHIMPVEDDEVINTPVEKVEKPKNKKNKRAK